MSPWLATNPGGGAGSAGLQPEQEADLEARMREFIREHYQQLRRDSGQLLDLANEFKDYGAGNAKGVLPVEMAAKLRKMEDVSHDLRKLMYSRDVPHVKSRTGVVHPRNVDTAGLNQPAPKLQDAAAACLELAQHLENSMNAYMQQTNQYTVSVARQQINAAYDVVRTAAKLEGLAYELRKAGIVSPQM